MLKRKIMQDLIDWKNKKDKKCLLVQGARQVGKTYIIEEFGKTEYEEMIVINFKETPDASSIFTGIWMSTP